MALFERVHTPSFAGATEWLNSEPLGPAGAPPSRRPGELLDVDVHQLAAPGALCPVRQRTLEITSLQPGANAYAFTFG
jgi:hypothetical protein